MEPVRNLVSVTIPIYNAERFLNETIKSVFAQTYTEWELLLVDDGSTDQSTEIARSWVMQYPEKFFHLQHAGKGNHGASATRNLGARTSRGEFLAFLDADDIWLPNKLEENIRSMREHPEAGFLFNRTEYWYEWDPEGNNHQQNYTPPLAPDGKVYFPPSLLPQSYPLGPYGSPCPCSFVMRRSAFSRIGGFEEYFNPTTFQMYDDIAFMAKVYLHVPVYVCAECLEKNRCNQSSMSRQKVTVRREEAARRFYFHWLREYLQRHSFSDGTIWRAVRRESWFYVFPLPVAKFIRRTINGIRRRIRST